MSLVITVIVNNPQILNNLSTCTFFNTCTYSSLLLVLYMFQSYVYRSKDIAFLSELSPVYHPAVRSRSADGTHVNGKTILKILGLPGSTVHRNAVLLFPYSLHGSSTDDEVYF